jgi:glutathione S-transferase
MRLYHSPYSSNARRARMTALHLDVKLDLVLVDLARGEQHKPEFLRMNPNGKVPVLDDEGFILWESHAIMQYLADKTPEQSLYPREIHARADVNRWLFWSAHHFAPSVAILNWETVVKRLVGRGEPDPAAIKRGEALVSDLARLLDEHLAGKSWIAQERLTLADFAIASPLMAIGPARLPVTDRANLLAWFGRVEALDAWRKTSI